jgi:hypothetical protein
LKNDRTCVVSGNDGQRFGDTPLQRSADILSAGRLQLAREPAGGIGFQGIDGKTNFFDAMASAAFEGPFFVASLARRNPGYSHPVLTGRTHRPLNIGQRITHHPTKIKTIFISSFGGLSGT